MKHAQPTPRETAIDVTRREVEAAAEWDMTERANRRGYRARVRRWWWARYGTYVSGVLGGFTGVIIGWAVTQAIVALPGGL